jgi:hypothetical protein
MGSTYPGGDANATPAAEVSASTPNRLALAMVMTAAFNRFIIFSFLTLI